ncbi:MAG: 50S ribosomal protein L3 [Candidatus Shapirobacteria bacterium]
MEGILGLKQGMKMAFDDQGQRWPLTMVAVGGCMITKICTVDKDGYFALQLAIGQKKTKQKGATKMAPLHLKEIRVEEGVLAGVKTGEEVKAGEFLKTGDKINVTGWTKGKGFAGGVKRWHFKGGPRTHGQSDRERAPGSIGSTTTPGRVLKGKRMAGRMGGGRRMVKNLAVMDFDEEKKMLTVRGLVPGAKNGLLILEKTHA